MIVNVNDFSDIEFTDIDPERDEFHLPNGKIFIFSDIICHACWDGGTVLEEKSAHQMICLRCGNELEGKSLPLYDKPEETEIFYLPKVWDENDLEKWTVFYHEKMAAEIGVREQIQKNPEGGEYL